MYKRWKKSTLITWSPIIIILIISFIIFVYKYNYPDAAFWDENYYIATAQKYLNGIFFLHEHPPVGHILIALGEKIIHANSQSNQFVNFDKAGEFPRDFSFRGYRLFPVLCAWLTPAVFYCTLFIITRRYFIAFLLSLLYVFDNALVVHSRGAMLDAPLMFFISLAILFFLLALKGEKSNLKLILYSILLGISFALAVTTKYQGAILILLFPALSFKLRQQWRKSLLFLGLSLGSFLVFFLLIWQLNFLSFNNINPQLKNNGYYSSNPIYQKIISQKQYRSILYLPMMLKATFDYSAEVNKGIPALNLCKSDENGSPAFLWPLGVRAINYRWETLDSGQSYRYLYLQINPIVWFVGFWGIISTTGLFLTTVFFTLNKPIKNKFLIVTFLILYWTYMLGISQLNRVTYLYHYFPALLFSFYLFALWIMEINQLGKLRLNRRCKYYILSILAGLIVMSYYFYSPLTYYQPLTDVQFRQRMIFPLWNLHCVKCEKIDFFRPNQ